MKSKILNLTVRVTSLALLVSGTYALAQVPQSMHFSGLINDYSPANAKGGPWEMHGEWSLVVNVESGTADFSADLTMSGYGKTTDGSVDATQPGQSPHTHHIRLRHANVTWDMSGCPTYTASAPKMGFQLNGPVSLLTANGTNAPFETTPPSSTLQVCVTGGEAVPYSVTSSNITLVFAGPATSHFGAQAIHGVVRDMPRYW